MSSLQDLFGVAAGANTVSSSGASAAASGISMLGSLGSMGADVKIGNSDSSTKATTSSLGATTGAQFHFAGKNNAEMSNTTTYIGIAVATVGIVWFILR